MRKTLCPKLPRPLRAMTPGPGSSFFGTIDEPLQQSLQLGLGPGLSGLGAEQGMMSAIGTKSRSKDEGGSGVRGKSLISEVGSEVGSQGGGSHQQQHSLHSKQQQQQQHSLQVKQGDEGVLDLRGRVGGAGEG